MQIKEPNIDSSSFGSWFVRHTGTRTFAQQPSRCPSRVPLVLASLPLIRWKQQETSDLLVFLVSKYFRPMHSSIHDSPIADKKSTIHLKLNSPPRFSTTTAAWRAWGNGGRSNRGRGGRCSPHVVSDGYKQWTEAMRNRAW